MPDCRRERLAFILVGRLTGDAHRSGGGCTEEVHDTRYAYAASQPAEGGEGEGAPREQVQHDVLVVEEAVPHDEE